MCQRLNTKYIDKREAKSQSKPKSNPKKGNWKLVVVT